MENPAIEKNNEPESPERREALVLLTALAGAALLPSCTEPEAAEILIGRVEELRAQKYLTTDFNRKRIFVAFGPDDRPYCLSLICTHKECTVRYREESNSFLCPCHKGTYDANGQVTGGKPKYPLDRFQTEVRNDEVWVLNQIVQ